MIGRTEKQNLAYEKARDKLNEGWNCGQSVLMAVQEVLGLENRDVLRAATGFGGGVGNMGHMCGGCAGGVLIIGQRYGRESIRERDEKERTYTLCAEWMKRFKGHFHSCNCSDILKVDLSDPEKRKTYWATPGNRHRCANETVGTSAAMLMEFIEETERAEFGSATNRKDEA